MVSSNNLIEKIFFLFGKIHPKWLKKKWFSFFHTFHFLITRLLKVISQIRLPVFYVNGIEKTSKEPLNLLFVGKDHVPHFVFNKLFFKNPVLKKINMAWIWDCTKIKQKFDLEVDGVVVSCDRFFHRFLHGDGWFVLPHWISMWFDSSDDFSVLMDELSRSASHDVKIVKKQGFLFHVSRDIKKIRFFYDTMYVPTISSNVNKDEAFIADFLFFLLRYHKGYELMLISYEGKEIAGVFFIHDDETIFLEYAGVYQADSSLIKKGAFSAIYYFAIKLAKQRNVKKIDFGGVRPFKDDGLFQYKRKWGMIVEPYDIVTDNVGFTMEKGNNQFRPFLLDNQFIGMDKKGKFVWYVFTDKKVKDDEKKEFEKQLKISGVKRICFIEI